MNPVSPVIEGNKVFEVMYADHQEEYVTLPVLRTSMGVMSRWRLTDEERKHIAEGGDLYIIQLNGGGCLQPILPLACHPEIALETFISSTTEPGKSD